MGDFVLRRRVFNLEVNVWEELMRTIEGVMSVERTRDKVISALTLFGRFFYKSLRRSIAKVHPISDRWKILWAMFVPLKV